MSQKWFNGLNLQQNQLENAVIQNLASDPSSGKAGQIYYNTTDNGYRYYNGTAWVNISADAIKSIVAGNGLTSTGTDTVTISLGTPSASGSGSNTYGSNDVTTNSHTHQINLPDASESAKGVIEVATDAEATAGTDTTRAINAKQLAAAKQSAIDSAKVTIQTSNGITGGSTTPGNSFTLSGVDASTTAKGVVQLAADNDTTSTDKAVTPKQLETARKKAEVSITAGNGLTGGGTGNSLSVEMGTPSTIKQNSTNSTTATSHTHKLEFNTVNSPAASGNEISFIDTVSQGADGGISATKKTVRSASATQTGVVQLATQDEVNTGANTTKVITPATLGKGKASGVASLDSNSKIITSQLPDYLLGQVMYGGNASTVATTTTISPSDSLKTKENITATSISIVDSATSTAANTYGWQNMEGVYFICQTSGTFAGISFETGDWIISTGTKWEKIDNTDAVKSVNGQTGAVNITRVDEAGTADKLKTARTIALSGDATGSTTFDGSANKEISVTLSNTGVTAGTYNTVTVDAKGRVTAATNTQNSQVTEITGDGTKTVFDIAHTLGKDVLVQVFLNGQQVGADTVDELVSVDIYTANNKVKLVFATAPKTTEKFKVVISRGGSGGGGGGGGGGGASALAKIYGVDLVGSEDPNALVRTDDAVGLEINVGTSEIISDFDNCYPWCDMQEVTDASGNVFIKIPKFYSKITKNADGTYKHQISGIRYEGFSTLFVDGLGFEIDGVLVGKYEGSGSSERVYSKSGQTVLTQITCDNFRTACKANGAGYQQYDFLIDLIIKELWLVEMKTTNCQSIMYGYANNNSAATNTGTTDSVTTPSGSPVSNTDGKHACKYRGIENLWGNIFTWCDGISFSSDKVYVCTDPASYTAGKIDAPYVYQGNCSVGDGWIKKVEPLGRNPLIQYVTEISRVGNTPYFCDYTNISHSVLAVGGAWSDTRYAGLWYWASSYNPSDMYLPLGGRLCYKPL